MLELYETSGWLLLLGSLTVGIADIEKPLVFDLQGLLGKGR